MNDLLRRRRAMMGDKSDVLDTRPKIAEYGKYLYHATSIRSGANWCYTKWIEIENVPQANAYITGVTGTESNNTVQFQVMLSDDTYNYNYMEAPRYRYLHKGTVKARFSLAISSLDRCYLYRTDNGDILFAAKGSPYYGYKNINDMPQG